MSQLLSDGTQVIHTIFHECVVMTDFWFMLYEPSSKAPPQLLSHTVQMFSYNIWQKAVEKPGNKDSQCVKCHGGLHVCSK